MKRKNTLILGVVITAFAAILITTMVSIRGTKRTTSKPVEKIEEEVKEASCKTVTAILKKLDKEQGNLTATDLKTNEEVVYSFTGGTKFISRYGQELMATDVSLGEIVELVFEVESNRVVSCTITNQAWEYTNISNWSINKQENTITVGSKKFSYSNLFQVFNKEQMIDSNALNEKDVLTIKGVDGQAYSAIVTKGHASLQLANYAEFIGGSIEIGYDVMAKVQEDQVFTVREGDYRVTVKKGSLEAVKYVHIKADEQVTVDLSDAKKNSKNISKVTFDIHPEGADLYINNVETAYQKPVELEHGTYTIKVSCNGYETYTEKFKVSEATEEIQINLVSSSLSKASASPKPTTAPVSNTTNDTQSKPNSSVTTSAPVAQMTAAPSATPSVSASPTLKEDTNHTITVNGPSGVKLYLNEEYKGTLPITFTKVIGTNIKCTLKIDGQKDQTYTMTVNDDDANITWQFSKWW